MKDGETLVLKDKDMRCGVSFLVQTDEPYLTTKTRIANHSSHRFVALPQ
jgi:hypothetical protein